MDWRALRIDEQRFAADFAALSAIGAIDGGGVSRAALGEAHLETRRWFRSCSQAAGLTTRVDAAGNHSALLPVTGARTLLMGSHLDSVARGGRFDGALGVLAALEAVRTVAESGLELPVTLEAIDFTDEEGTLVGLLGSFALTGQLTDAQLRDPRGGREALAAGLRRAGLDERRLGQARRDAGTLAAYLELHVEQGPRLEREGMDVGVVTSIVGSRSYKLTLHGAPNHAGTTAIADRADALLGAARVVTGLRELVVDRFPGCVATAVSAEALPGRFGIVPGEARLAFEFRAPEQDQLDALDAAVQAIVARVAAEDRLDKELTLVGAWEPAPTDPALRATITSVAARLGLSAIEMPSGAGHDAQALARVTPTAMIFVPSVGGISHDPAEETAWQDCVNGANLLLQTALQLALG